MRGTVVDEAMEHDRRDVLEGLTRPQKSKVLEWIEEFKLSLEELSAWRRDRKIFLEPVKYKVRIETPVDLICRDIYELKQFGDQVAEAFYRNKEPSPTEFRGRKFTKEGVLRWVLIRRHLRKPFLFNTGEPQHILNSLSSRTGSVGPTRPAALGCHSRPSDPRSRERLAKPGLDGRESADQTQEHLNIPSVKHARAEVLHPRGVSQSKDLQRTPLSAGGRRPPLSSTSNYPEMIETYLRHFGVEVHEFSEWLIASFGSDLVPQDELFPRADILLTSIAEALLELEKDPKPNASEIAHHARRMKISPASLQKWSLEAMRPLFFRDKTALKYELFRRVFAMTVREEESWLSDLRKLISFESPGQFFDLEPDLDPVALVGRILDFYSLDSEILDELPIESNRGYRERTGGDALQMLLHDLSSLISDLNEVSMFSRLFSPKDVAFICSSPQRSVLSSRNMFHVSMGDAIGALQLSSPSWSELEESREELGSGAIRSQKIRDLLVKYGSK